MKDLDNNSKQTVLYICDKKGHPVVKRDFWIEPKQKDNLQSLRANYYKTDSEGKISFGSVISQEIMISVASDFVQFYRLKPGKNTMRIALVHFR